MSEKNTGIWLPLQEGESAHIPARLTEDSYHLLVDTLFLWRPLLTRDSNPTKYAFHLSQRDAICRVLNTLLPHIPKPEGCVDDSCVAEFILKKLGTQADGIRWYDFNGKFQPLTAGK